MANEKDTKVEKAVESKTKPSKEDKAAKKAARKAAKEAQKNAAKKEGKEKLGFFAKIAKFFRDYKSEFGKLVWPSRQQLAKNSAVVLVSIVVCGAALWAIDWLLGDLVLPLIYDLVWRIPGLPNILG